MKWIAIAGTWRLDNVEIEARVRDTVRNIISQGNGVVSGGALGIDFVATDEALAGGIRQMKIIIPSTLDVYRNHYLKRAEEGVITKEQAVALISQLERVKELGRLIEGSDTILNKETYFNRITKIVESADELIAFQVNGSEGTQDTIDKARKKGIPVKVFSYSVLN